MTQAQPNKPNGAWVRLYLASQSEGSGMPESVVGFLSEETASGYVLIKTLQYEQDDITYENVPVEVPKTLIVNRTYVWAVEVMGERPISSEEGYNGAGGLG